MNDETDHEHAIMAKISRVISHFETKGIKPRWHQVEASVKPLLTEAERDLLVDRGLGDLVHEMAGEAVIEAIEGMKRAR